MAAVVPLLAPGAAIPIPLPPAIPKHEAKRYVTPPADEATRHVPPTPPREGRFEPREEAEPVAPDRGIDYDRLADQLRPGGEDAGPTDGRTVEGIVPVDPDKPVDYVEVLPVAAVEVMPEYPEIARQAMVEGRVIVLVLVGRDGRVRDAKVDVNRSVPMLDEAALDAARRWVFSPALVNDRPVAVWTAIPFRFTLQ